MDSCCCDAVGVDVGWMGMWMWIRLRGKSGVKNAVGIGRWRFNLGLDCVRVSEW